MLWAVQAIAHLARLRCSSPLLLMFQKMTRKSKDDPSRYGQAPAPNHIGAAGVQRAARRQTSQPEYGAPAAVQEIEFRLHQQMARERARIRASGTNVELAGVAAGLRPMQAAQGHNVRDRGADVARPAIGMAAADATIAHRMEYGVPIGTSATATPTLGSIRGKTSYL